MGKLIPSPLPGLSGFVVLSDPLSLEQAIAFQGSLQAVQGEADSLVITRALLPGVAACVEYWHIPPIPQNPTPETFPAVCAPLIPVLVLAISNLLESREQPGEKQEEAPADE